MSQAAPFRDSRHENYVRGFQHLWAHTAVANSPSTSTRWRWASADLQPITGVRIVFSSAKHPGVHPMRNTAKGLKSSSRHSRDTSTNLYINYINCQVYWRVRINLYEANRRIRVRTGVERVRKQLSFTSPRNTKTRLPVICDAVRGKLQRMRHVEWRHSH